MSHASIAPSGTVRAKIVLSIPKQTSSSSARSPRYLSPATASLTVVFTPTGETPGGPQTLTASLTPTSNGCTSTLASTMCTLTVALAAGTYVGSFSTVDASGNPLSSSTNVPVTITMGATNTIAATLGALPASYAIAPYPGSFAASKPGVIEPVGLSSSFIIDALDADGNVIVGPGAPSYAVALTGHSGQNPLALVQPTTTSPNTFGITAAAFDGIQQTLTLTATLADGATCGGAVICTLHDWVVPQEIIAMDSYQPTGTIQFRAFPDLTLALPALTASGTAQGLIADASGNLFFFDGNSELAESTYPYTGSTELPLAFSDTSAVRLAYNASNAAIDVSDPAALTVIAPPYSGTSNPFPAESNIVYTANPQYDAALIADGGGGLISGTYSSFAGDGDNSFDAIYCATGFGMGSVTTKDALLETYDGAGTPSMALEYVSPNSNGFVQAFPVGNAIAQPAYQIACDTSGYVTVYYNGALNRFKPGSKSPMASVAASLPYQKPFGLSTDAVGNVFYAQGDGLIAWDGASTTYSAVKLSFTPGNIAIIP